MDPIIISAIIITIGSLVGTFVLARLRSQEKKKANMILEVLPKTLEQIREEAMKRGGYAYEAQYAKYTAVITGLDGNASITKEYRGVSITEEGMTLSEIPEEVWVGKPGTIACNPELVSKLKKPDFHKQIDLIPEQNDERFCKFRIEIEGGLTKADGEINYGYSYKIYKAVCMSKEEAEEAYKEDKFKKEYVCFDVRFPIKELEVEVAFPEGYDVKTYTGVFLGGSETWNDFELQKIRDCIKATPRGACLNVKNPVLGFRYLIFWTPITNVELMQLRSKES